MKKIKKIKLFKKTFKIALIPIVIFAILGIFLYDIYTKRDIAAIVCGEKIYKAQVDAAVNRKIKEYQKDKIDLNETEILAIRKQILNDLIEDILLDTYAKEHNIVVTEEEVKNEIQKMREYTGLKEDDVYKQALSKYQLLESDINEMVRSALLADKVYYEIIKDLKISDEELWDYFIKRVNFYNGARRVSHIFIAINYQKDTIDEINSKYEKMKKIKEEILKGKKFEDLVKEYSEDLSTKETNGDLFWFRKGTISDSEISKAVFSLNKGEISEVIKSQYGFHIFKITDSVPENLSSLKEAEIKKYYEKIKELVKIDALYQKSEEKIKEFNKSLWEIYKNRIQIGNTWDKIISVMNKFFKKPEGS